MKKGKILLNLALIASFVIGQPVFAQEYVPLTETPMEQDVIKETEENNVLEIAPEIDDVAVPYATSGILSLSELQAKFPAGKYWNHAGNPGAENSKNNQDGVTNQPCTVHGVVGTSKQTCNGFAPSGTQLSWQCMGYAEKLGYDSTGYNPRSNADGWHTYTSSSALDNLKAGDIVRYKNNGHSIFVTDVDGDTVTYTDCNSDGHCIIKWNQKIAKSTLKSTFTHLRSAPKALSMGNNPQGKVDSYSSGTQNVTIRGWAFDKDDVNAALEIHVWIDGWEKCIGTCVANLYRPDVCSDANYPGVGEYHGYEATMYLAETGNHNISVWAINVGNGDHTLLGSYDVHIVADTTAPSISEVKVEDITVNGYTVSCKVTDDTGVNSVRFATWTDPDQDDIKWDTESEVQEDVYRYRVNAADHNNEQDSYMTHIYASDRYGNENCVWINEHVTLPSMPRKALDFDGDFYAYVKNDVTGTVLTNKNNANAVFSSYVGDSNQVWHFIQNEDGSYRLSPKNNEEMSLDVEGAYDNENGRIQLYTNNDTTAQKWDILEWQGMYYLKPQCSQFRCLDLPNANPADGTEAVIHTFNIEGGEGLKIEPFPQKLAELETDFYASIENCTTKTVLTGQNDGKVVFSERDETKNQIWHFVKENGHYQIFSTVDTNELLGISGNEDVNRATVILDENTQLTSQAWDIYIMEDGSYFLQPNCTELRFLDLQNLDSSDGVQATINKFNIEGGENFNIKICKTPNAENPFADVKETDYYHDPVLWAVEQGITTGKDATHFQPDGVCTRAQVVTFLWRANGQPEPTIDNPFVDVDSSKHYYKAVLWALENGITQGKDSTHFQPDVTVNRNQVVTFMWRAEGQPEPTVSNPFVDVPKGSFYEKAVLWAYENEITLGKDATHFQPEKECIRAQVVTFLYRNEH